MNSFCVDILAPKNFKAELLLLTREKLHKILSYKKGTSKTLMKLTPEDGKETVNIEENVTV